MSLINLVCLISNILGIHAVYKWMHTFLGESKKQKVTFLLYGFAYLVSLLLYFISPKMQIYLPCIFLLLILLSLNHSVDWKKRVNAVISIFVLGIVIMIFFISLFELRKGEVTANRQTFAIIGFNISLYIVALIFSNWKNERGRTKILLKYWMGIITTPIFSLGLVLLFFIYLPDFSEFKIISTTLIITAINIAGFYLHNTTIQAMQENSEKYFFEQQNKYYAQQLANMQAHHKNLASIRHDINNHLIMLKSFYKKREFDEMGNYLDEMALLVNEEKLYSQSGNSVVDSIINYKLGEIRQQDVQLDVDINIPPKLLISDFDLTTILGNLLDNAIFAMLESESKKLSIGINYRKGQLILRIHNSYQKIRKNKSGAFLTTKSGRGHGLGLKNVKEIVKKYDGMLKLDCDENLFSSIVILCC